MEQLYETFTNDLLPTIQEGLVITQEYFTDLFGRYIQYLLITDILLLVLSVLGLIVCGFMIKKGVDLESDCNDWFIPFFILGGILGIFSLCGIIEMTGNVAKDIYIPEIRVYEELNYQIRLNK